MVFKVDARGLPCPQPVVLTNKAIEEDDAITVIVDNEIAKENVALFAKSKGFEVRVEQADSEFKIHLTGTKQAAPGASSDGVACGDSSPSGPIVLTLTSDTIGRGSDALGEILMTALVQTIGEVTPCPEVIVLMNSGVKLACKGSKVIEDLKDLVARDIKLLVCGTCLGFYELTDRVLVGQVSNTFEVATQMMNASKVVSL
ncbi:MAG: sulfurtransferase-like selenium metabolism protein YedF [Myxococcota bacterium]|nr:sulfurtransferase-like selenium metabolism protein YedF [Myxococcota bacterium]